MSIVDTAKNAVIATRPLGAAVRWLGGAIQWITGISKVESLASAANIMSA